MFYESQPSIIQLTNFALLVFKFCQIMSSREKKMLTKMCYGLSIAIKINKRETS